MEKSVLQIRGSVNIPLKSRTFSLILILNHSLLPILLYVDRLYSLLWFVREGRPKCWLCICENVIVKPLLLIWRFFIIVYSKCKSTVHLIITRSNILIHSCFRNLCFEKSIRYLWSLLATHSSRIPENIQIRNIACLEA